MKTLGETMFKYNTLYITNIPQDKRQQLFEISGFKITNWSVSNYEHLYFSKQIKNSKKENYVWNGGVIDEVKSIKYKDLDILDFVEWCKSPAILDYTMIQLNSGFNAKVYKDYVDINHILITTEELRSIVEASQQYA